MYEDLFSFPCLIVCVDVDGSSFTWNYLARTETETVRCDHMEEVKTVDTCFDNH